MTIYEMIEIIREEVLKQLDTDEVREGLSGQAMKLIADQSARFAAARICDQRQLRPENQSADKENSWTETKNAIASNTAKIAALAKAESE